MPYFTSNLHPEYHQCQQMNALDPFLQAILAQLQEPEPEHPQQQSPGQKKPSAAAPATMRGAASGPRPKPTCKNVNRSNTAFTPRFDVFETTDAYHLHGDLPGVSDKKSISIEFSDERTMLICGRVERPAIKPAAQPVKQIEEQPVKEHEQKQPKEEKRRSLKPTVEDTDDEDDFSVVSAPSAASTRKTEQETAKKHDQEESHNGEDEAPPKKVWLSERTYGAFQRTFSFPNPVDLEGVSAKLEDGLLTVVVPKVVFSGARKIEID